MMNPHDSYEKGDITLYEYLYLLTLLPANETISMLSPEIIQDLKEYISVKPKTDEEWDKFILSMAISHWSMGKEFREGVESWRILLGDL